jgi:hypothetical protein
MIRITRIIGILFLESNPACPSPSAEAGWLVGPPLALALRHRSEPPPPGRTVGARAALIAGGQGYGGKYLPPTQRAASGRSTVLASTKTRRCRTALAATVRGLRSSFHNQGLASIGGLRRRPLPTLAVGGRQKPFVDRELPFEPPFKCPLCEMEETQGLPLHARGPRRAAPRAVAQSPPCSSSTPRGSHPRQPGG